MLGNRQIEIADISMDYCSVCQEEYIPASTLGMLDKVKHYTQLCGDSEGSY